jgi:nuclear pore complex protein Nup155
MERQNNLGESLRYSSSRSQLVITLILCSLFMKGARILDIDQLREVVGDYQQLDFAKGAIELPLHCAQARDVDGQGQEYWHTVADPSAPSNDPRKEFWDWRAKCYDLVLDSLETFDKKSTKGEEAERVRVHAYELAFASADEIFHSRLYDWLISRGLADELLEVRQGPSFDSFKLKNLHGRCVQCTSRLI